MTLIIVPAEATCGGPLPHVGGQKQNYELLTDEQGRIQGSSSGPGVRCLMTAWLIATCSKSRSMVSLQSECHQQVNLLAKATRTKQKSRTKETIPRERCLITGYCHRVTGQVESTNQV